MAKPKNSVVVVVNSSKKVEPFIDIFGMAFDEAAKAVSGLGVPVTVIKNPFIFRFYPKGVADIDEFGFTVGQAIQGLGRNAQVTFLDLD